MVARTLGVYSLADIGVTAANYNFATLIAGGTFTASATAAPTLVTVDDTDTQDTVFNDGTPGSFAGAPVNQLLTGNVDGTIFTNEPSNPENEFRVTDSNGDVVGFIYDLHNANSAAFASLQGYTTTFKIIPGETYSVVRTNSLPTAQYVDFIACFTRDTLIDTETGLRAIQGVTVGERVRTLDHGLQTVRWIGSRSVPGKGAFAPICIRKGALGNARDLFVSPQHRMLISGWRAEMLFGEKQVLAPAKALVNDKTIIRCEVETAHYIHILFDQHEIIFAEGCPSESFYLSELSLSTQDDAQRAELLQLFPELGSHTAPAQPTARMVLKAHEATVLKGF